MLALPTFRLDSSFYQPSFLKKDFSKLKQGSCYIFLIRHSCGVFLTFALAGYRLRRFMSFTPHSTQSMAHRTLIAQLARKHKKINKTKQFTSMEDPEKMARDAEKVKEMCSCRVLLAADKL